MALGVVALDSSERRRIFEERIGEHQAVTASPTRSRGNSNTSSARYAGAFGHFARSQSERFLRVAIGFL